MEKSNNNILSFNKPIVFLLNIITIICYIAFIISIKIQFISINELDWYHLGMGKYLGLFAILGIICIFNKKYYAAFFISLFAAFFSFHEVIIFFDNFAIEKGCELGDDGLYRSIIGIFLDEVIKKPQLGAFWAIFSSSFSLFFVSIIWILNTINENILVLKQNSKNN